MTIQTKHYLDFTDIITFRFQCKQCEATLCLLASDTRPTLALSACPNCRATWTGKPGLAHDKLILDFRGALQRMQDIMDETYAGDLGFKMTLEVKPEAASRAILKSA